MSTEGYVPPLVLELHKISWTMILDSIEMKHDVIYGSHTYYDTVLEWVTFVLLWVGLSAKQNNMTTLQSLLSSDVLLINCYFLIKTEVVQLYYSLLHTGQYIATATCMFLSCDTYMYMYMSEIISCTAQLWWSDRCSSYQMLLYFKYLHVHVYHLTNRNFDVMWSLNLVQPPRS